MTKILKKKNRFKATPNQKAASFHHNSACPYTKKSRICSSSANSVNNLNLRSIAPVASNFYARAVAKKYTIREKEQSIS